MRSKSELSCQSLPSPTNRRRVILFAALLVSTLVTVAHGQKPQPVLPKVYVDTTWNLPVGGTTWAAHTAAQLKSALQAAAPGDIIVLDAGATYTGNFVLPAKTNPNGKWIYIQSSAYSSLPAPGTRVGPADAVNMAKIVTPNATTAVKMVLGANDWRLTGLEITSASTFGCNLANVPPLNCYTYNLVYANGESGTPLPDSLTIDRCYIHGSPTQDVRQGVFANGTNMAVVDSYISDIHQWTNDSQAFLAYWTPGPIKLVNNLFSASTEDVMFGGAGGPNNPYVPSDIEIRNNWFYKPLSWAAPGVTLPPHNQWVEKNGLEIKGGQRMLIDSNTIENTWTSGQEGYGLLLTVRMENGNHYVTDDITVTNNILKNVEAGFMAISHDGYCGTPREPNCANGPGEAKRINIYNNLVLLRDQTAPGATFASSKGLHIDDGMTDFVFQHNSIIPFAGQKCYWSMFFDYHGHVWPPAVASITHNLWLQDNVLCREPIGYYLFGTNYHGTDELNYYMGDPEPYASRFFGNAIYVPAGDLIYTWPANNLVTTVPFTYVNPSIGDFQLLTPQWTDTTDGKIAGVDNSTLP